MHNSPRNFKHNAHQALQDNTIRSNFRGAMDFLRNKRRAAFPDRENFEQLSAQGEAIKQRCLQKLPQLLKQLEQQCQSNGIQVHWAETAQQANQIVQQLITDRGGRSAVKGKSMVTEEIGLTDHLNQFGIDCIESDMGEYIVQLAKETPSHIIMPAIHKNAEQIGHLFADKIPNVNYTTDVDHLINTGREQLRQRFYDADVGISGVNFAIAETGTLCLVENEGNGRMTTTVPNLHIAVTGIEKVVELLADVPPLLKLLTRSATGQAITTYVNMITRPRQDDERDGPEEVHLVLLDNGRSQAFADDELRKTLQCIRCGACMNYCPVYTRIGGHAYGTVYPGPIGQIFTPHQLGLEQTKDLPTASSLCGACEEVCPVKIPIPKLLQRLRVESNKAQPRVKAEYSDRTEPVVMRGEGSARRGLEALLWKVWAGICSRPALYRAASWAVTRGRQLIPNWKNGWTQNRTLPKPASKPLHERLKNRIHS